MDFVVVTSVLGIVEQQLFQQPHPCLILPDIQIIESLSDKLRFLQAYLQESDPEAQKRLHKRIRDVAAEAEDKMESKLSEVYLAADKGEHAAVEAACEDLHQTLQQVVKDIESVEVRIRDLQIRHAAASTPSLQLEKISDGDGGSSEPPENVMIGLKDEFEKIRKMLVNWRSERREVISIVGKGGVGKTTLAQRLYHDPSIMDHFDTRAWTTVSQEFSNRNVLNDLLGCIDSLTSEISDKGTNDLAERLYKSLKYQRYLIVIDDIWDTVPWDDIQRYFPNDSNGSRILMTTRLMEVAEYASSSIVEVGQNLRRMALEPDNIMIGLEDKLVEIMDALIESNVHGRVISILGPKGSGKTTLARTVYGDPFVASYFDIQGWATVSQEFSVREVLISILHNFAMFTKDFSKDDTERLREQLYKSLKGQRYLIVIDGIQVQNAWGDIRRCFPNDFNGSRILITTPSVQVARYACSPNDEHIYHTRPLNQDESWNLFVTKVFNGKHCPEHLLSVGKNIVEKCNGLPLAIVVIAGLLSQSEMSPKQWENIANNINQSQMLHELSYNSLPSHLRACFLYLGNFPKNSDIHVKKLIKLWVAEGFLKPETTDKSLEDVAEDFLLDLIARNLVRVMKRNFDEKVKSCRLHDSLQDFCFRKAQEESTLAVSNEYPGDLAGTLLGTKQSKSGCRWMSCQSQRWPVTRSSSLNCTSSKIRSILYFGKDLYLAKCRFEFPCLKLLKVLDLSLIKYWHGMPSEIVDLIHLRYLALTTTGSLCNIQLLKLQNLQTLNLFSWKEECCLHLPCEILDLPWLRHVHLDKRSSLYLPNLVRENLQTLFWLKVTSWDSKTLDFTRVPNLKELGIYIEGEVTADALDSLVQLYQLEKLKFEMGRVERFNLPFSFPPNIKKLTLCNTYLPWEEMDVIDKLPNLMVLKLKDFAFCGTEWEPRDGGFQRLKFLLIAHSNLEHWNATSDHFPVLECLVLRCCWYLKELPYDLAEIARLRLIELIDCCPSLVYSAKMIQEEMLEYGMDDLIVRHSLTEDKSSKEESESAV